VQRAQQYFDAVLSVTTTTGPMGETGILRAASDWRGITWTLRRLKVQAVELDVDVMLENGSKVKLIDLCF
jgi:hypothetical protein